MDQHSRKAPRRRDTRIILHFDYDCFYASVFENQSPALKSLPLGVKQKSILATCNYVARRRGVKKLMVIAEAKKICPELVLVDGEDLTPFRDMSKTLFSFLRAHSWSKKVERLGFDEVFMDVTEIIDYNVECLSLSALSQSFFYLSSRDPEKGFACDLTSLAGPVLGSAPDDSALDNPLYVRLLLASHLAWHLRLKLEEDFGFTSTCGISTNKLLSKLVGSTHKPRNQTTLLALRDEDVFAFMDGHPIRRIPGFGARTTHLLESNLLGSEKAPDPHTMECTLTAHEVRGHPQMSSEYLEKVLGGPGAERGVGAKAWNLLHGIDEAEVKEASDVPTQISIEDTYKALSDVQQIADELRKLASSLVRRMRVDLLVDDENSEDSSGQRWMAHPKTLRLSIRNRPADEAPTYSFGRTSRSQPLPMFIFDLKHSVDDIAARLSSEALIPMLGHLGPEPNQPWNLSLLNICVTNMAPSSGNDRAAVGRDISVMFRKQDDVLRQWKIATTIIGDEKDAVQELDDGPDPPDNESETSWGDDESAVTCPHCGHSIPAFATSAHARYHEFGE